MVNSTQILTVSYGTFSCTLEGFDDPFNTMKNIAEYFRDLAADDRYFGAEPPQPDAEMLHRIAQREVNRQVEARVTDDSVVLRQIGAEAAAAPVAAVAPLATTAKAAPEVAEPAPEVVPEATPEDRVEIVSPQPAPEAAGETVTDKLNRIRAAVARARATEDELAQTYEEDEKVDPPFMGSIDEAFSGPAFPDDVQDAEVADTPSPQEDESEPEWTAAHFLSTEAEVVEDPDDQVIAAEPEVPEAEDEDVAEAVAEAADEAEEAPEEIVEDIASFEDAEIAADIDAASAPVAEPEEMQALVDTPATPEPVAEAEEAVAEVEATAEVDEDHTFDTIVGSDFSAADMSWGDDPSVEVDAPVFTAALDDIATDDSSDEDTLAALAAELNPEDEDEVDLAELKSGLGLLPDTADTNAGRDEPLDSSEELAALAAELGVDAPVPEQADAIAEDAAQAETAEAVAPDAPASPAELLAPVPGPSPDALDALIAEIDAEEEQRMAHAADRDTPEAEAVAEATVEETPEEEDALSALADAWDEQAEATEDEAVSAEAGDAWDDEEEIEIEATDDDAPQGRIIRLKRRDFEAALAAGDLEEIEDETAAELEATDETDELEDSIASFAQAEATGAEDAAQDVAEDDGDHKLEDDIRSLIGETSLSDEDEEDLLEELASVEREAQVIASEAGDEDEAVHAGHDEAQEPDNDEDALNRLLSETNAKLDDSESSRRRSAIAHLKAAVAATRADRQIKSDLDRQDRDTLDRYRSDLAKVVRPRRPADASENRASRGRPVADILRDRAAPLMLVSEQRVDIPEEQRKSQPVQPRRIASQSEDEAAAGVEPQEATAANPRMVSFEDFAHKAGAKELPDLLEAATAYATLVEGQEGVSRPAILRRAASLAGDAEISREQGLQSFGMLLRTGRIRKLGHGRFGVNEETEVAKIARAGGE